MKAIEKLRNLAGYYRDVLSNQVQSSGKHLINLRAVIAKGLVADISPFIFSMDSVLEKSSLVLKIEPASPDAVNKMIDEDAAEEEHFSKEREEVNKLDLTKRQMSNRLTAIYRKQQQDPFNRETILGFPILAGRYGNKNFGAPLFYFTVKLDHDPLAHKITITRVQEEPILNSTLLATLVEDESEGNIVRAKLQPLLSEGELNTETIVKTIKICGEIVKGLRGLRPGSLDFELVSIEDALSAVGGDIPKYFWNCVVVNAARSHAFLQDDLATLSQIEALDDSTVLDLFLSETDETIPDEADPILRPDEAPLLFPFKSNPAQRKAASKAEKARLMTIQGPPGTGKSQTIANLVCHLVAMGHSVLVTSHQNKALEVVMQNLPQIDYLAMPLLRGDKESINALKTQLEQYDTFVSGFSAIELQSRITNSFTNLGSLKSQMGQLHSRFTELKAKERENSGYYYQYRDIREFDKIDPEDNISNVYTIGRALENWRSQLMELLPVFGYLRKIYAHDSIEECDPKIVSGQLEQLLRLYDEAVKLQNQQGIDLELLAKWRQIASEVSEQTRTSLYSSGQAVAEQLWFAIKAVNSAQAALSLRTDNRWSSLVEWLEAERELLSIQQERQWLNSSIEQLMDALDGLGGSFSLNDALTVASAIDESVVLELSLRIGPAIKSLQRSLMPSGINISTDRVTVEAVGQALSILSDESLSWFKWHFVPSQRSARGVLKQLGYRLASRTSARGALPQLRAWYENWYLRHEVASLSRHLKELGMPVEEIGADLPLPLLREAANRVQWISTLVVAAVHRPKWRGNQVFGAAVTNILRTISSRAEIEEYARHLAILEDLFRSRAWVGGRESESGVRVSTNRYLEPISQYVMRFERESEAVSVREWARSMLRSDEGVMPNLVADHLRQVDRLNGLSIGQDLLDGFLLDVIKVIRGEAKVAVQSGPILRSVVTATPAFSKYIAWAKEELSGLTRTRLAVEDMVAKGEIPAWLNDPAKAVEAYRLSRMIREDIAADPDDLESVARAAQKVQKEYRREVLRALEYSRKLAIKSAQNDHNCARTVSKLKTLLGRKRKTFSLLSLRSQIDYKLLLRVFPCWVMSIEDVARVFPLTPGLFDYVIVDEASQCQQATALHLSYRTKRMLVVGDRKQLQSAATRFFKEEEVRFLLRKHNLEDEFLKYNARLSFLELAEYCSQAKEFLNEHFRCEPSIIQWSNKQFYDNKLIIVTPLRTPHFSPSLEWRLLRGVDDDPERKVNEGEAEAIVDELYQMIKSGKAKDLTIGVISLFRQQANHIHNLIHERFNEHPDWIRNHELIASTADGFQGDERDIILYSLRYGASTPPSAITTIEIERERLNVAFTRARRKVICFSSVPPERFPKGLVRSFLEHAIEKQHSGTDRLITEDHFDSEFERDVCTRLRTRGFTVSTQVPCGPFRIDLVMQDSEGRRLAIECDGEFHFEDDGYLRPDDYQRQDLLERAGWTVHRISSRSFYLNPDAVIRRVEEVFYEQPTGVEQELIQREHEMETEVEEGLVVEAQVEMVQAPEANTSQTTCINLQPKISTIPRKPASEEAKQSANKALASSIPQKAETWWELSHWGKVTGLFSSYNNRFCYGFGLLLARKQTPTPKQSSYAQQLWKIAIKNGFQSEIKEGSLTGPTTTVEELHRVDLPARAQPKPLREEMEVYVCERGKIHTYTNCPALANQDTFPSRSSLKEAIRSGSLWCPWCLAKQTVLTTRQS